MVIIELYHGHKLDKVACLSLDPWVVMHDGAGGGGGGGLQTYSRICLVILANLHSYFPVEPGF